MADKIETLAQEIEKALLDKHNHDAFDARRIAEVYLSGDEEGWVQTVQDLSIEEIHTVLEVFGIGPEEVKKGIEKIRRLISSHEP